MPPDKKRNSKSKGKFILIGLFILVVLYLISYENRNSEDNLVSNTSEENLNTVNFEPTGTKFEYTYNSNASFYTYDSDNFYFCTKDSLRYMTSDGEEKWEKVFTMSSPVMVGNCENVIVFEPGGNNIYIFSPEGLLYEKQLDGTVQNASINKTGMSTVIVKTNASYETNVYDNAGNEIVKLVHENENIYPITADISDDGAVLAISLLDINGVTMTSSVEFRYLDERAKDTQDGIFGGKAFENQLVANLMFLENNLVAFSDSELNLITINEDDTISIVSTIPLTNKIDYITQTGSEGFAIALGSGLANKSALPIGTVEIYNSSLVKTGECQTDGKVSYLYGDKETVCIGTGRTFLNVDLNGNLIWKYNALEGYTQVIPLDKSVLFVGNTDATVMKKKK